MLKRLRKYLLFRCGIFIFLAVSALLFCMFVLGKFAFDCFKIFRYEKTEAVVYNAPSLKVYKNKRGTDIYTIHFNAEYIVDETTYSTDKILPLGNITSNCAILLRWNYRCFMNRKNISVYYNPENHADGFALYIGEFVCMIISVCCCLTVGAIVVIRILIKKILNAA